jgi:hypothetical protein
MTLYLFKVHLQMFLYIPITQKCQILDCDTYRKWAICIYVINIFFSFIFNRHSNPCGLWPDQLLLSILSRKVFTECRCQRHVKPPTWRTSDQNVPTPATRWPSSLKRRERTPAAEGGTMGEKLPRILPKVATSTSLLGSFTCRRFTTWYRRLYFPSEGRRAEDFFARKIRRLRPGLNPRTWVPKASTLTSRPCLGWRPQSVNFSLLFL